MRYTYIEVGGILKVLRFFTSVIDGDSVVIRGFSKAIDSLRALPLSIMFYEGGGEPLESIISQGLSDVGIFIGAEGGFSQGEVDLAKSAGVHIATLGPRILRTETAPICALSVIMYANGEMRMVYLFTSANEKSATYCGN